MSRFIRTVVCGAVLSSACTAPGFAAEPAKPAPTAQAATCADRYMTATHVDDMMKSMTASMGQSLKGLFPNAEISSEQRARIETTVVKVMTETMNEFTPKMLADIKPMMLATYDETELCAMADFYGSPTGQSIIAKMPALMEASMAAATKYVPELQKKMVEGMCRELDCKGTPLEKALAS